MTTAAPMVAARPGSELLEVDRLAPALTADWLEQHGMMPLRLAGGRLEVGSWLPAPDPTALDDLRLLFDADVVLLPYGEHDLRSAIRRVYAQDATTAEGLTRCWLFKEEAGSEWLPRPGLHRLAIVTRRKCHGT